MVHLVHGPISFTHGWCHQQFFTHALTHKLVDMASLAGRSRSSCLLCFPIQIQDQPISLWLTLTKYVSLFYFRRIITYFSCYYTNIQYNPCSYCMYVKAPVCTLSILDNVFIEWDEMVNRWKWKYHPATVIQVTRLKLVVKNNSWEWNEDKADE